MHKKASGFFLTIALAVGGLTIVWGGTTSCGRAIPGELLDARLNNYLLEHLWQWCQGRMPALWSPSFFYPYEHVLAFSDNHFGTGVVYGLARSIGMSRERAFDFWFLFSYPLNFASAWYVLRRLNFGSVSAAFGAFVFTFSLPVFGQVNHAQLGYRFAIPLAIFWLQQTLERSGNKAVLATGWFLFWTGWQFACSIYLGFFLCMTSFGWVVAWFLTGGRIDTDHWGGGEQGKAKFGWIRWIPSVLGMVLILGTLIPYALVSREYHFVREEWELLGMIPRTGSYLIADDSWFSGVFGKLVQGIPMRHEHQLFLGFFPFLLLGLGGLACVRKKPIPSLNLVRIAFICLVLLLTLTTVVAGYSFYYLLIHLPLANALRSVSRITLVMLFPVSVICAGGVSFLQELIVVGWLRRLFFILLAGALLLEISHFHFSTLSIVGMRDRITRLHALLPDFIPKDSILFVEKDPREGDYLSEVDAMILAQELGLPTWNGYSGNVPPGHGDGRAFSDAVRQMALYSLFRGKREESYRQLVQRILPLRSREVFPDKIPALPVLVKQSDLTQQDCEKIVITIQKMEIVEGNLVRIHGTLFNGSNVPLRSVSLVAHPVRFTWKWIPLSDTGEETGYAKRCDLDWDLPPFQTQEFTIDILPPDHLGLYDLKVTLLEEGRRFLNDQGMKIPQASSRLNVSKDHRLNLVSPK